jgi:hypothetical protein
VAAVRPLAVVLGRVPHAVEAEADARVPGRLVPVDRAPPRGETADRAAEYGEAPVERLLAHDVHGPGQRVLAVEEPGRALEHLDRPDVVGRVVRDRGLLGAVGHHEAARYHVESADGEVIVDARSVHDVQPAHVLQGVRQHAGALLVDQGLGDRAHVGRGPLQWLAELRRDGVRGRNRGVADLDVLDELAAIPSGLRVARIG